MSIFSVPILFLAVIGLIFLLFLLGMFTGRILRNIADRMFRE